MNYALSFRLLGISFHLGMADHARGFTHPHARIGADSHEDVVRVPCQDPKLQRSAFGHLSIQPSMPIEFGAGMSWT